MWANEWTDRFGSVASSVCAIHCAVCAFLPVAFSAVGLGFLLGEQTEWMFTLVAVLFGVVALVLGWLQHRSKRVASLLILGVVGLMASRGLEMGTEHHDGESHHAEEETHHVEAHADEDEHHEEAHDDSMHLAGAVVGVLAGLILMVGHISNIREGRRCTEENCG